MSTYKVEDFTDLELYSLLELSSTPTDNELEARIIQMLQRHMYLRTHSGKQLFQFFKDIYEHFFDMKKNTQSTEDDFDNMLEELEKMNYDPQSEKAKRQQPNNVELSQIAQTAQNASNVEKGQKIKEAQDAQTALNAEKEQERKVKEPVAFTKELLFAPGKINPLLKETYTRTISIDSQYRDKEYSRSTDFTVNFNETLKDVVKMKLYAVQIPVTWYTISNSYGSNFFYLKPREVKEGPFNTLGIYNKSNHEYKIEIQPGNYDAAALVTAVNGGIQKVAQDYPDVSLGNTKLEYNNSAVKTTFTFDIQKVYNEFHYSVSYGENTRELLGIQDTSNVPITTIYTDLSTTGINFDTQQSWPPVPLTNEQKTLYLTQQIGNTTLKSITIEINQDIKTWDGWIYSIHTTLQNHPDLTDSSFKKIVDVNGKSYFEWILKPKVPHVVGAKWTLTRSGISDLKTDLGLLLLSVTTTLGAQASTKVYKGNSQSMVISNETVVFRPIKDDLGGVYISETDESNAISLNISNGSYTAPQLIAEINRLFAANLILNETSLNLVSNGDNTITPKYTINKIYTTRDYQVVFYDINSFSKCTNASASYRNATIDTTLGYILGFHSEAAYEFDPLYTSETYGNPYIIEDTVKKNNNTINTRVTLTSDSVVNVYLYTYFMIILDDFNQNHLNDGLVTLSRRDYSVSLPSYANRKLAKQCNPVTNTVSEMLNSITNASTSRLTQHQVYSVEQILAEQNRQRDNFNQGVYVRDMFALLPVKTSGAGSIYVEFGGTLQQQERVYFGPVNIRRISVKLVNDKGDVVDLNGGNWSFQLVCEQLYQRGE